MLHSKALAQKLIINEFTVGNNDGKLIAITDSNEINKYHSKLKLNEVSTNNLEIKAMDIDMSSIWL